MITPPTCSGLSTPTCRPSISGPRKVPHALAAAGPSQIPVQAAEAAPCRPDCQPQSGSPNFHSCSIQDAAEAIFFSDLTNSGSSPTKIIF